MRSIQAIAALAAAPVALAQGGCSPLHFVYARATTEPPTGVDNASPAQFEAAANRGWSKGYGAAGKSMFGNITALIPGATGWPVHYPASWGGCASEDKGVADIIRELSAKSQACPDTKFALGGHSQGGVVTVRALAQMPADLQEKIISVTMVGSPDCPAAVKSKCRSYCNKGDGICVAGGGGGLAKGKGGCGTVAVPGVSAGSGPPAKSPSAKGKGFAGKGAKGGKQGETEESAAAVERRASIIEARAASRVERRQYLSGPVSVATCSQPEVPEKDHQAKGKQTAHLAYNSDGYFLPAAACFVYKQLQKSKGL